MTHKDPAARKAYQAAYREKNREDARRRSREFRQRHPERARETARVAQAARYARLKDDPAYKAAKLAQVKKWYAANKPRAFLKAKVHATKRRKLVKQALPAWANKFFMAEVYDLAQRRTAATGVPHEVDHIAPLRGRGVCGLHVETNLRVVPKAVNRAKGASLIG